MRSIITGASNPHAGLTEYTAPFSTAGLFNTNVGRVVNLVAMAGVISNFRVHLAAAPGVGESIALTLRVNGVDTGITLTVNAGETTKADLVNTASISAGDQIELKSVTSATITTPTLKWVFDFVGTVDGKAPILGGIQGNGVQLSTTATEYLGIQGCHGTSATENNKAQLIASAGVIDSLYVKLGSAPGSAASGKARTFTVYKNGSPTALTCTILETATTGNDLSHSISVVAGDLISIESVPVNTPAASRGSYGTVFTPTVYGEFPLMGMSTTAPSTSSANYTRVANDGGNSASGSTPIYHVFNKGFLKKVMAKFTTAPSAGKSYAVAIYANGAITPVTTTIADANVSNQNTDTPKYIDDYGIAGIVLTPTGTPTSPGIIYTGAVYVSVADGITSNAQSMVGFL